jgi:plastocyanin
MTRLAILAFVVSSIAGDAHGTPDTGELTGTVTIRGGTSSHAVVYIEKVPGQAIAPKQHAVIRQRDKQFDPPLTIVVRGTTVDFPNEDKIFHNVFSVSQPARFDLGLYKSGTTKSVEMRHAGTVDVYCNIHPDMVAKVKILENAFYAITDDQGRFRIQGLPPGELPVVAWLPSGDQATGTVTVTAGGVAELNLEIASVTKAHAHARKDGTPYGRYQ